MSLSDQYKKHSIPGMKGEGIMNKELLKQSGFGKEVDRINAGKCPFCGKMVKSEEFRNEISKKEFTISGLCQKCQDEMFGKD